MNKPLFKRIQARSLTLAIAAAAFLSTEGAAPAQRVVLGSSPVQNAAASGGAVEGQGVGAAAAVRARSALDVFREANEAAARRDFASAAALFHEAQEPPTGEIDLDAWEGEAKLRSEVELAHSLLALGLFDAAIHQYDYVLSAGPNHPAYVEAAEGVLLAADLGGSDVLASAILDREYGEPFARLPPHLLDRLNLAMGILSQRGGKPQDADGFLSAIPDTSPLFPQAAYLRGVGAARQGKHEVSLGHFTQAAQWNPRPSPVMAGPLPTTFSTATAVVARDEATRRFHASEGIPLDELRQLATLGQARALYALGRFGESAKAYESLPRFSRFWEDALFENGWARMQDGDDGGALGTLQALHAPQLSVSFQPESWILFATIHFTRCLFPEARSAMKSFDDIYAPQSQALKDALENREEGFWIEAASRPGTIPEPVRRDLVRSRRYQALARSLSMAQEEQARIEGMEAWKDSGLRKAALERNGRSQEILRRVLSDFVRKRVADASARLDTFDARKEILELEIQRVEASQLQAHFGSRFHLEGQSLGRPASADSQVYWPFDGEFWLDEVGHYRFTLKNGCMPESVEGK